MSKRAQKTAKTGKAVRSQAEQIDREMAARAIKKRGEGELPTRDELAALRRFEKAPEILT